MLTEYKDTNCRYQVDGIKNLYLVSENAIKNIKIDNGSAYISSINETPLNIECFNIQATEEESLDDRYEFHKTVTFSVNGYAEKDIFGDRRYVILEYENGSRRMVNIDFPSVVSYQFTLSDTVYQTDFTFETFSNFPTLRLLSNLPKPEKACFGFNAPSLEKIRMILRKNVRIDRNNRTVYSTTDFVEVKPLTFTFQENYSNNDFTDTVTFTIPINDYNASWHYNITEFQDNLYSMIAMPKSSVNQIFIGFNGGLSPTYDIEGNIITITMVELSNIGAISLYDFSDSTMADTKWVYTDMYNGTEAYVCVGNGTAYYGLQKEVDGFGNETGRWRVHTTFANIEPFVNNPDFIGTFSTEVTFNKASCYVGECSLTTNMPNNIIYTTTGCSSFTLSSNCDWSVQGVLDNVTISPMSGNANSSTNIQICNNSRTSRSVTFTVRYGYSNRTFTILVASGNFINPTVYSILCPSTSLTFNYDSTCDVTFDTNGLSYTKGYGTMRVNIPMNETTSSKTYTIIATNCNGANQVLTINQNRQYQEWRQIGDAYICDGGKKYQQLTLFTGTTAQNLKQTNITKKGDEYEGDTTCASTEDRWVFDGNYTCIGTDKYELYEREVSNDGGITWTKTGETEVRNLVERNSSFCGATQYRWVLSDEFICEDDI